MPRAALLIIGNEILSGKFPDENAPWLAVHLRSLGVDLVRIETIPDEVPIIAESVRRLRAVADWVFSSGGVGPTHDDVTMEGVAAGLGVPLHRHPELLAALAAKLGPRMNADAARMADVPAGAELWWDGDLPFPQVVAGRVIILPGVPGLFRRKVEAIAHRLGGVPLLSRRLVSSAPETDIAAAMREAQDRHPTVAIGSYPRFEQRPWTVIVTLDSRDADALAACEAELRAALGPTLVEG
jgi:molybdenum cofactor synthesis domain-containing protein